MIDGPKEGKIPKHLDPNLKIETPRAINKKIVECVAKAFRFTFKDLVQVRGGEGANDVAYARYAAMYVLKQAKQNQSERIITATLGRSDPSIVVSAKRAVEKRMSDDSDYRALIERLVKEAKEMAGTTRADQPGKSDSEPVSI